jgi:hypothetical protein
MAVAGAVGVVAGSEPTRCFRAPAFRCLNISFGQAEPCRTAAGLAAPSSKPDATARECRSPAEPLVLRCITTGPGKTKHRRVPKSTRRIEIRSCPKSQDQFTSPARAELRTTRVGMSKACTHLATIRDVTPSARGCEECLKIGSPWVHLRICRTCGHVGCCDDSPNRHATKHFHATAHPIIEGYDPPEHWGWCYVDEVIFDLSDRPTLQDGPIPRFY